MSNEELSRSPELEEVLRAANEYFLEDVHTSLPGRIEEYDSSTQKCSVKPLIKRRMVTGNGKELIEELPILPDVPVAFQRSEAFFMSFPLKKGDHVMVHFMERSIDKWLAGNGADTDPGELRKFDFTDAVAVPGLYPFKRAVKDAHKVNMVIGHDKGGMQFHITPNGTCEFKIDGEAGEVVMLGKAFKTWWESVIAPWLATHTHPTGVGPSGPPIQPLPSFDAKILSTLLKLAAG